LCLTMNICVANNNSAGGFSPLLLISILLERKKVPPKDICSIHGGL
jgi:hypothetical protein